MKRYRRRANKQQGRKPVWELLSVSIKAGERVAEGGSGRVSETERVRAKTRNEGDKEERKKRVENLQDMKQKVWSMGPSVTSLIKTSTFIRHRAFCNIYAINISPSTAGAQRKKKSFAVCLPTQTAAGETVFPSFIVRRSYFGLGEWNIKTRRLQSVSQKPDPITEEGGGSFPGSCRKQEESRGRVKRGRRVESRTLPHWRLTRVDKVVAPLATMWTSGWTDELRTRLRLQRWMRMEGRMVDKGLLVGWDRLEMDEWREGIG